MDHSVSTTDRLLPIRTPTQNSNSKRWSVNCRETGVPPLRHAQQEPGSCNIIGPELGITQPGQTIVCGDSHTSTHGRVRHAGRSASAQAKSSMCWRRRVPGTEPLPRRSHRGERQAPQGRHRQGHHSRHHRKTRHRRRHRPRCRIRGEAIRSLSMDGRMTVCNMTIEGGARAGMSRRMKPRSRISKYALCATRQGIQAAV